MRTKRVFPLWVPLAVLALLVLLLPATQTAAKPEEGHAPCSAEHPCPEILPAAGETVRLTGDNRRPKMHHPQLPDLSVTGLDVDMSVAPLADDFRCMETGPIDMITIWGSFLDDKLPRGGPASLAFRLAIHADIPAGQLERWSMPGETLWSRQFEPGQYLAEPVDDIPEGWYDPLTGQWERDNHVLTFRYDFPIVDDPFVQRQGTIYWLEVKERTPLQPDYRFGWKTTPIDLHWQDDAVFWMEQRWFPMEYPDGHPQQSVTLDLAFEIGGGYPELEYGDAPEGARAVAYPSGVTGSFPTCWSAGPAGWIQHNNFGAFFGPTFEFEADGDASLCPPPGCFPPYDQDECFQDRDAGLLIPEPFTMDAASNAVPCPNSNGTPLGLTCQVATWGANLDIEVHNHMPSQSVGFVNVLIDWDQDGQWGGASICPGTPPRTVPEHVLVDFAVPNPYDGPLSAVLPSPPSFLIGPKDGFVWARFSITERQVGADWHGEGNFEDGETEDYLLLIRHAEEPTPTATATTTRPPSPTATSTVTRPPSPTATSTVTRIPSPTATSTVTRIPSPTATATSTERPTLTPTLPLGEGLEYGDAPEGDGAMAYPWLGIAGGFPTCRTLGPAGWVQHVQSAAFLGPAFDLELDGNAGCCPMAACFPPYDRDECFQDRDAGLLKPEPFTIDTTLNVVPCPNSDGTQLGQTCQVAIWGVDIDLEVHNHMPGQDRVFVNVLIDWNQDGRWDGSSPCPGPLPVVADEHVLVDYPVPSGYDGPLSALSPPSFLIGPKSRFVWARFSITERPVSPDWKGEGSFEGGESEDYLLWVGEPGEPTPTRPPTVTPTSRVTATPGHRLFLPIMLKRAWRRS